MEGDTLWKIGKIHQISLAQIIQSNRQLENPNLIFPGQVIAIPIAERNEGHNERLNREEEKLADLLNRKRSQFGMKPLMIDLKNWLSDPETYKPGNKMTGTYGELTPEQLDALTAYLMGLKVQGE